MPLIGQDQLDDFLTAAEELKIEGLTTNVVGDNKTEEIQSPEQGEDLRGGIKKEACVDTFIPSLANVTDDDNTETSEQKEDVVLKKSKVKRLSKSEDASIKQVSKVYCYEKIPIQELSQIKTTIEAMSERVGKVWRCKFCGKTTLASQKSHKNTIGLHIETHFEGLSYR